MAIPRVRLVNMIPKSVSGETNQDSEPQITIDPDRRHLLIGTAFTPDPGGGPNGPVFASIDGGETWTLDLIVPGGEPHDQSVRFGRGSALYAGVLRGNTLALNILRSAPYSPSTLMQILVSRTAIDQPYVSARPAEGRDRVFVGNNDAISGPYRGSVEHSPDARGTPPPAGFAQTVLDPRLPFIRELPPIRCTAHHDGTVYAAYQRMVVASPARCDVVVARDDNFATGASPFTALTDPGDGLAGVRVVQSVPFPWTFPWTYMGNERVGAQLAIAAHRRHNHIVYLCWGEGPEAGSTQTLHVRRSIDRGATWSGDLLNVPNATNPTLAITENGKVGLLYQQVVAGSGGTQRWHTHVRVTHDDWATPAEDFLLADTPVDNATYQFDPYIGDYADLQALDEDFYGIFSAHNLPNLANFPHGVHYQRNHDFGTQQLFDVTGITPVSPSIDPFFVHISWREEREERRRRRRGRERLHLEGVRYERLEIDELSMEFGEDEDGDGEEILDDVGGGLRRLSRRLSWLGRRLRHERDEEDEH